jgi:hypothetical protein
VAAIGYGLEVIAGYLRRYVSERSLVVVLGDHRPFSGITGTGKPESVPIHVLCRDPGVLAPFLRRGYESGFVPRQPLPHAGLETFLPGLLRDFSSSR